MSSKDRYKHVNFLWDEQEASKCKDEVELLIYRSNILGSDLRITNFGGGNTSCKTMEKDPLTGEEVQVMWVKGSGGDIGTLTRQGLAGLYVNRLHQLKSRYRGLAHEDEMVALFYHCLFDLQSKAPSIDTPLHAFLPYNHIDHLHPDALIALAAAKDGEGLVNEIYGGTLAWVPWQRPGFDLGLQLEKCIKENPELKGIVLGGHGLFTWGDTALECYSSSLDVIEKASLYLEDHVGKKRPVFGGQKLKGISDGKKRRENAISLFPLLRGLCSSSRKMIGHFSDDKRVLEFINSQDMERLAPLGTSCPDHFLRTKINPLVLQLPDDLDLQDQESLKSIILPQVQAYRKGYKDYYEKHRQTGSPSLRDTNPVVILWPGVGMFTFAKDKATARVSSEFYINAIQVMRGAEAVSSYVSLSRQEAFNIEYWQLEEDKLKRMPPEKPLSGRVGLVTGSGGGIGRAIAEKLMEQGACMVFCDNDKDRLQKTEAELKTLYKKDQFHCVVADVTEEKDIVNLVDESILNFGGLDLIVNNAGISVSRAFSEYSLEEWDRLYNILVRGQFLVSKVALKAMKIQGMGGDVINIVSKNALVSGPKNAGYGSAKAAQLHLSRLMAAELADYKIRVNTVNPDAVISDSKIWQSGWAEDRAKAYGVKLEDLPQFYANRTLLKEIIYPQDIAEAVMVLVGGKLNKSTGNMINVDGGLPSAFPR